MRRPSCSLRMLALLAGLAGLAGPAVGPARSAAAGEPGKPDPLETARAADQKAYEAAKEGLRRDRKGKWVAIADGKVVTWGSKPEEVLGAAPKAIHRYVFQVGEEGDADEFASEWYGPRFGGLAIERELGLSVSFGDAVTFEKDGKKAEFSGGPFPRSRLRVAAPGGKAEVLDVQIGSVGPPLVLTPADAERLGLSRAEIPGTLTISGRVPCRRVLVRVGVDGLAGDAWIAAGVPALPRAQLAALARGRDAAFLAEWSALWEPVRAKHEGQWVLFGVDRILGEGATAAAALLAGEGKAPEAQHRWLVRLPLQDAVAYDRAAFAEETTMTLGGEAVKVRTAAAHPGVVLADAEVAGRLALEMAEDGRETAIVEGGEKKPARLGAAWKGAARLGVSPAPPPAPEALVWVLYPVP